MADFPFQGDAQVWEGPGIEPIQSLGTIGTINTKTAYTQLVASTARQSQGLYLVFDYSAPTVESDNLVDVAIGTAGSEQVLVANMYQPGPSTYGASTWYLPIQIKAGTRLACRFQGSALNSIISAGQYLPSMSFLPSSGFAICDTYGANTADSGGTQIDPGGDAHTKGSWVQLSASTTRAYKAISCAIGFQGSSAPTRGANTYCFDIGVGGAGSEQVILPDMYFRASNQQHDFMPSLYGPLPVSIPAGVRLSVRAASGNTGTPNRLFDIFLYCFG